MNEMIELYQLQYRSKKIRFAVTCLLYQSEGEKKCNKHHRDLVNKHVLFDFVLLKLT